VADLGQFPFRVRGVDLSDTARIDAKGQAVAVLDTAVFPEARQAVAAGYFDVTGSATGTVESAGVNGVASGTFDVTGAAQGAALVSGQASGAISLDGAASGTVSSPAITGQGGGSFDVTVSATATTSVIVLYRGDDAPDWRRRFYDRQIKEFEEALEAIPKAEEPQDAAQEAVEAFTPLAQSGGEAKVAAQAITEALRGLTMQAMKRKEMQHEIADIRAELARIEAYRRKKRNNEAAILLLAG
jgi:hypothetical protein